VVLVNLFSCVTCANNSDHVSPRYAVATARCLPLPSGVGQGPDGAAGADVMEGDDDSDVAPHGVCERRSPHEDPPLHNTAAFTTIDSLYEMVSCSPHEIAHILIVCC
jgi:hypothetical protein